MERKYQCELGIMALGILSLGIMALGILALGIMALVKLSYNRNYNGYCAIKNLKQAQEKLIKIFLSMRFQEVVINYGTPIYELSSKF